MLSNYTKNNFLRQMLAKGGEYGMARRAFLGLSTTTPQPNGQGVTEPQGNGYKRIQVGYYDDVAGSAFSDPADGVITNSKEIHFNESTGAWGTVAYACLFDSETNGNLLAAGEIGEYDEGEVWQPKPIETQPNRVLVLKEGAVKFTME